MSTGLAAAHGSLLIWMWTDSTPPDELSSGITTAPGTAVWSQSIQARLSRLPQALRSCVQTADQTPPRRARHSLTSLNAPTLKIYLTSDRFDSSKSAHFCQIQQSLPLALAEGNLANILPRLLPRANPAQRAPVAPSTSVGTSSSLSPLLPSTPGLSSHRPYGATPIQREHSAGQSHSIFDHSDSFCHASKRYGRNVGQDVPPGLGALPRPAAAQSKQLPTHRQQRTSREGYDSWKVDQKIVQQGKIDLFSDYYKSQSLLIQGKGKEKIQDLNGFDAFELIAREEAVKAIEAQESTSSRKTDSALVTSVALVGAMEEISSKPDAAVSDRFDWRQTAQSFRRRNLETLSIGNEDRRIHLRRPPSSTVIESLNARSPQAKARIAVYQQQLSHLVELEREYEKAQWEQLRSRTLAELISEGWAMDGLVGYWQGGSLCSPKQNYSSGQSAVFPTTKPRIAVLTKNGLQKLGWTRLKSGDKVMLRPSASTGQSLETFLPREQIALSALSGATSRHRSGNSKPTVLDGSNRPAGISGNEKNFKLDNTLQLFATVLSSDSYRLRLLFQPPDSTVDLEACQSWRLDMARSDAIDVKIDEAIDNLAVDANALATHDIEDRWEMVGTELAEPMLPRPDDRSLYSTSVSGGEDFSAPLLGSIFDSDLRIRSWYERYLLLNPVRVEGDPDLGLNGSQMQAVATMLSRRLSLIQVSD